MLIALTKDAELKNTDERREPSVNVRRKKRKRQTGMNEGEAGKTLLSTIIRTF